MIKKSVLKSFGQYNVPKMALALLVALIVGIVIYCVYRRFYTGVVYSRSFAVTLVGMTRSHLHGYSGDQYEYCDFPWYGRCIVYRTFPYSGEGSDGSALSCSGRSRQVSRPEQECMCW